MLVVKKIKSASVMGNYKPTVIDKTKAEAQLLLQSCDPKIVHTKIELKGAGIKKSTSPGVYQVSNTAWNKLTTQYNWMTDF